MLLNNYTSIRQNFEAIDRKLYQLSPESYKVSMDGCGLFGYTNLVDPKKIIDVGISEQLACQVLFGLSISNDTKVYLSGMSSFILRRSYEQLKLYINNEVPNVTIIGYGSGVSYGALGPSHHIEEDLALLRLLDNIKVYVPHSIQSFEKKLIHNLDEKFPVYFRIPNELPNNLLLHGKYLEENVDEDITLYKKPEISKKLIIVTGFLTQSIIDKFKEEPGIDVMSIEVLKKLNIIKLLLNSYLEIEIIQDARSDTGIIPLILEQLDTTKKITIKGFDKHKTGANLSEMLKINNLI
ncbi:TPA: hypothetical protein ACUOEK_000968 [Streptococcus pneumoniae]|uniref:hypothetical protein n=1 Tax=Streptococcus pneumoniae TaxID=1313 RepID=UPI0007692FFA|nr:hypothetical protein [Streptococcus pneumoniae]MDS2642211.1 hypothetical protein [Streptococcus pneumoniae]MDS2795115.1 hypothetical protein [Streptococcus pneumoniae]MDS2981446.1 hypothetical protein [Streptococcus pneumoniae]MDS3087146.1 hypothetical protein [Streptococcus pneumoniae]MDS3196833.1 hypothetical protein [Streptococcus pneumoniae]